MHPATDDPLNLDSTARDWQPDLYSAFAQARSRPVDDLLRRVPVEAPERVADLGCGNAASTLVLKRRWPAAEIVGVDHSPAMLEKAAQAVAAPDLDRPDLQTPDRQPGTGSVRFVEADIADWSSTSEAESFDVLFSNAALHWLGGHAQLIEAFTHCLRPGGWLAVQMPLSWSMPSHRLMRDVLSSHGPNDEPLGPPALRERMAQPPVAPAASYYRWLTPGYDHLDLWETEYQQVLSGDEPVYQFVRSTGLRPILDGLQESALEIFLERFRAALLDAYPTESDGSTLYPFRRFFFVARKRLS